MPALLKGFTAGVLNRESLTRTAALRRLVKPNEVAAAVVWMLSDEASGITGINLPVDAGFYRRRPLAGLQGTARFDRDQLTRDAAVLLSKRMTQARFRCLHTLQVLDLVARRIEDHLISSITRSD